MKGNKKPRYTKAGEIFKNDAYMIEQGWPKSIEPGEKPVQVKGGESTKPGNRLEAPNALKRKGRC